MKIGRHSKKDKTQKENRSYRKQVKREDKQIKKAEKKKAKKDADLLAGPKPRIRRIGSF